MLIQFRYFQYDHVRHLEDVLLLRSKEKVVKRAAKSCKGDSLLIVLGFRDYS